MLSLINTEKLILSSYMRTFSSCDAMSQSSLTRVATINVNELRPFMVTAQRGVPAEQADSTTANVLNPEQSEKASDFFVSVVVETS